MKEILAISSLGLSLILGVMFLTPTFNLARAGVEPSPFQPEINQLGAVANILSSADFRVVKTMSVPPDPCTPPDPCKGLNGAVNRLEAIDNQIGSTGNMILSMINEVMGTEPSPFREDLIPALEVVRDAADSIAIRVDSAPLDTYADQFTDALLEVAYTASQVSTTAQGGIDLLSCSIHETEAACDEYDCEWVPIAGAPGYCTWEDEY